MIKNFKFFLFSLIIVCSCFYLIGSFINSIFANLEIEKSEKFEVLGYDLNKINESSIPLLRRKIGFVFQDFKLLNDRSIYENLEFVLKATGHNDKQEIDDKVKRALKLVGINTSLDKLPNELSGGEQQRVATVSYTHLRAHET